MLVDNIEAVVKFDKPVSLEDLADDLILLLKLPLHQVLFE